MTERITRQLSMSTLDLHDIDKDHLARQALQLFCKRYGQLYDSHLKVMDTTNKGYVTSDEMHNFMIKRLPCDDTEAAEIINKSWVALSGGYTPTEVTQLDRQKLIELCVRGYHSKDHMWVQRLVDVVTTLNRFHFDYMDTNHDGLISKEEFTEWAEKRGNKEKWQENFEAIDMNGDGHIDREEWLQCNLGFFFHIDKERFNHFFGRITDLLDDIIVIE